MTVKMTDVPLSDRPRERLVRLGTAALSDAELVALQLGSGCEGISALDLAHRLLAEWNGLAALSMARPEQLAKTLGVGQAKAVRLCSAFALATRMITPEGGVRLSTSDDIARVAMPLIGHGHVEHVLVLIADGGLRLKRTEVIASGTAKSCPMPVREILAAVLRHDGTAFAVAHNHPGGDPAPTSADIQSTRALRAASESTGLRFLDHVVVGSTTWASIALSAE